MVCPPDARVPEQAERAPEADGGREAGSAAERGGGADGGDCTHWGCRGDEGDAGKGGCRCREGGGDSDGGGAYPAHTGGTGVRAGGGDGVAGQQGAREQGYERAQRQSVAGAQHVARTGVRERRRQCGVSTDDGRDGRDDDDEEHGDNGEQCDRGVQNERRGCRGADDGRHAGALGRVCVAGRRRHSHACGRDQRGGLRDDPVRDGAAGAEQDGADGSTWHVARSRRGARSPEFRVAVAEGVRVHEAAVAVSLAPQRHKLEGERQVRWQVWHGRTRRGRRVRARRSLR